MSARLLRQIPIFNHENIRRPDYANRYIFKDLNHMNEGLVESWNSVVGPDDIVYHCGDMLMGRIEEEDGGKYLKRLNGTINIIFGNHDRKSRTKDWFLARFASYQDELIIEYNGKKILLYHYFNREKFEESGASVYFHGHSHNRKRFNAIPSSLDVGCDAAFALLGSYRPFTIDEALSFCE